MTVELPDTREFHSIRHLAAPAYNPLNAIDSSVKLAQPCTTCGAQIGQPCGKPCHRPQPVGPTDIHITPGDGYDSAADQ